MVRRGHRAIMLYLVQRTDCDKFRVADTIDPAYSEAYKIAKSTGVENLAYACAITPTDIRISTTLPT